MARGTRRHARGTAGFSLLELMLVILILGTLSAIVAFNVVGGGEKAKRRATEVSLKQVRAAISNYQLEYSSVPTTLQLLISTKILEDKRIKDGWDTDIVYEPRPGNVDRPYALVSAGPDKQPGTPDDIDAWTLNQQ